jgi:hypothetical protein
MDELTASQLNALQNLALKKSGGDQPFINIGAARALTELGLAERGREGWDITAAGAALLARLAPLKADSPDEPPPPTDINRPR